MSDIRSITVILGKIRYEMYKRVDGKWMYKDLTTNRTMTLAAKNSRTWAARRPKKKKNARLQRMKKNARLQRMWRRRRTLGPLYV